MSDLDFSVHLRAQDGTCRVPVAGELDMLTAPELSDELRAIVDSGRANAIVVDLGKVTFIDSSGLRALLEAGETSKERGVRFVLSVGEGPVKSLLALAGVMDWFEYE